jgi:hypothetical protein
MSRSRSNGLHLRLPVILFALLAFTQSASSGEARERKYPAFATSADDAVRIGDKGQSRVALI